MNCFPGGSDSKESACSAGDPGSISGWEDPLEKEMATHSSILAWKIPWMKEPGRLQSMGSQRVGHDWANSLHFSNIREILNHVFLIMIDACKLFHFHALEKEMATHSSVLAWRIPGTGEPGGLLSMGSHRVGHNWSNLAYSHIGGEGTSRSSQRTSS